MKLYSPILLSIATLLAVSSCVKSEIDDTITMPAEPKAIAFEPSVDATRAEATTEATFNTDGKSFNVATFFTGDKSHYYTDIVTRSSSVWSGADTYYWPVNGGLDMFAYSPMKDFVVISNAENFDDYSLTYTCPQNVDEQEDLLVTTLNDTKLAANAVDTSVEIPFHHALSSIKFQVEFQDEVNILLNSIAINYVDIERERTYNFSESKWESLENIYFDKTTGLTTYLTVNQKAQDASGSRTVKFENIPSCLMIIPQPIHNVKGAENHYLSVQLFYTINTSDINTDVITGVMALPAPDSSNEYKMGEAYTYRIKVNGEKISIDDTITDQEKPEPAYGNINLDLISARTSPGDLKNSDGSQFTPLSDNESAKDDQFYYTTALRVKKLLDEGVRDFVVVGDLGAITSGNALGTGKIGFYDAGTNAFNIGAHLADNEELFSVDLRGTYGYPLFKNANQEGSDGSIVSDINPDDPIMMQGLLYGVDGLREVLLPRGIMAIGDHAFADCDALETIDVAQVKHIEAGAFQHSALLRKVRNGDIMRVHKNSFDSCTSLESIDLSLAHTVDELAFVNCSNLTNVNLTELKVVGDNAFKACAKLELSPDGTAPKLITIGAAAFSGCVKLGFNDKRIDLTEATYVGDQAFEHCTELKVTDGKLAKLAVIGEYAFADCAHLGSVSDIELPLIDDIQTSAFEGCPYVDVISGLERLQKISLRAFKDCSALNGGDEQTIYLPKVSYIEGYGFQNSGVVNVKFGYSDASTAVEPMLTTIKEQAFANSTSLETLSGLDNVTEVDAYAFNGCSSLTELVMPKLTSANCEGYFMSGCSSLRKIDMPLIDDNTLCWTTFHSDGSTSNDDCSFINMICSKKLELVNLPSLVTDVPGWGGPFQGCAELISANLASATSVDAGAFDGCTKLKNIDLTAVTSIGGNAFQYLSSLESVTVTNLQTIGANAFIYCGALSTIDLTNVTEIGQSALQNCSSLTELVMPHLFDGDWGGYFFNGCSALKKISLPELKVDTKYWEEEVTDPVTGVVTKELRSSSILDMIPKGTIEEVYLPALNVSVPEWSFQDKTQLRIVDLNSAPSIGVGAFYGCAGLEIVDVGSAITVGTQAFQGCTVLESIDIRSATSVGIYAFSDCPALTKINLSGIVDDNNDGDPDDITTDSFNWDTTQYEIWLSAETYARTVKDGQWLGKAWKAIHNIDSEPFPIN